MGLAQRFGRIAAMVGGLGLAGSGLAQAADQPVSLSPTFKQGQEMTFSQKVVRTDTMRLPMGEQMISIEQDNTWTGKVVSVEADKTVLELQFQGTKVKLKESLKQGEKAPEPTTASWDSSQKEDDKDAGNPLVNAFKPFVGSRFKVTLTGNQISGVEQMDTFSIPMTKYAPFVRQTLDTDQIRYRWQPLFGIKSQEPKAAAGQEWKEVVKMPTPQVGVITETTNRKLEKMSGDDANITFTGSIEVQPAKADEAAPAKVKNSTITGAAVWDAKAGMPKSLDWKQAWTMEINAQGLSVERTSDWTMSFARQ